MFQHFASPATDGCDHHEHRTLGSLPVAFTALVFLSLVILVATLRFPTLFRSELSADDSLLLIEGRALMRGATPYADVWDHHPPGPAALFGLLTGPLGYSYVALRWLTIAAIVAECFLLYLIGARLAAPSRLAGCIAAIIYGVYSMTNGGWSSDRVYFAAPLAAVAIYLAVRQSPEAHARGEQLGRGALLTIGALLALNMQFKYTLPAEFAPVFGLTLLAAWRARRVGRTPRGRILAELAGAGALLFGTAVALHALLVVYFASRGALSEWVYAVFVAPRIYAATTPFGLSTVARKLVIQFQTNTLVWAGLLAAVLHSLFGRPLTPQQKRAYFVAGTWFIFPLLAVLLARRVDAHHFLQVLPGLSMITGLAIAHLLDARGAAETREGAPGRALLTLLILAGALYPLAFTQTAKSAKIVADRTSDGAWPRDPDLAIAGWLNRHSAPQESLYVVDYSPVLYTLVDRPLPTRYLFPAHLIDSWYAPVIGKDQVVLLNETLARRPAWIVRQNPPNREFTNREVEQRLSAHLAANYRLAQTFAAVESSSERAVRVEVYRRQ